MFTYLHIHVHNWLGKIYKIVTSKFYKNWKTWQVLYKIPYMSSCLPSTHVLHLTFPHFIESNVNTRHHSSSPTKENRLFSSLYPKESNLFLHPRSQALSSHLANRRLSFPCSPRVPCTHEANIITTPSLPREEPCPMQEPISKVIVQESLFLPTPHSLELPWNPSQPPLISSPCCRAPSKKFS